MQSNSGPSANVMRVLLSFLLLACVVTPAWGRGVRVGSKGGGLRGQVNSTEFQKDIKDAIGASLGCGGAVGEDKLQMIEKKLLPMWRALPKNSYDRVERRSLRYLAHRYFMQQSSLMIRGFEPSRPQSSSWGNEDILSQQVPAYVESVLESTYHADHGFGMQDAVHMISMLEQLIFDSESAILEKVYKAQRKTLTNTLSKQGLQDVFDHYIINWMLGSDDRSIRILVANRTLREQAFPHWHSLVGFFNGQLSAMQYRRGATGKNGLQTRFTFDDAHEVVGSVTKSFASYWESECQSMKMQLVDMDKQNTGRVPLSKFYGSALDTEWRFGESESYLRQLGALDESSSWRGKQVIIPNYIQAASNCIVSTSHYLVCCVNDCENLLGEIEVALGAPVAAPSEIISLVANMTAQTTLDDDESPKLEGALTKQLNEIAAAQGGKVPLHGRLFAQWLHYVFPRDCPFPHKAGSASFSTPSEYGESYLATNEDMKVHASDADEIPGHVEKEEMQWMSQWSAEEELHADYSAHLGGGGGGWLKICSFLLFALASVAGIVGKAKTTGGSRAEGLLPMSSKAHFV